MDRQAVTPNANWSGILRIGPEAALAAINSHLRHIRRDFGPGA